MNATERVHDALRAHGSTIKGAAAQCPAHEDHNPSMTIRRRDDDTGVMLYCHAGCTIEDITAALGMTTRDLFDNPREPGTSDAPPVTVLPSVAAEYPYVDEQGTVLYVKQRYEPKSFRQYVPTPTGGKSWKLNGVRRVLYRLPDIIDAIANHRTVYLVEGEKDADNVTAAGETATCNPEGAGKWRPEYTQTLKGAHVIIVADRDTAGRAHAAHVAAELDGVAATVTIAEPTHGKDVTDHLRDGRTLYDLTVGLADDNPTEPAEEPTTTGRAVTIKAASSFPIHRVRWLWEGRIACGTLSLLAGREGLGKSICAYWLAARITRGELDGEYHGQPKGVLVCATEDSWSHTIVPRLIAAGADLDRVFCVEVHEDDIEMGLSLPKDLHGTAHAAELADAVLLLLDPLLSRLAASLDTHKDADVRRALEPLSRMADQTGMACLGIIHVNKAATTDPINAVMGSRAFTAVARSVNVVIRDPDDEHRRLFGTPKNNLGRTDLPLLPFTVESHPIESVDGTTWTGRVDWQEPQHGSIHDVMERATEDEDTRTNVDEAGEWLVSWLATQGGEAASQDAKKAGRAAGHNDTSLKRALRQRRDITVKAEGMPRRTYWRLNLQSGHSQSGQPARGEYLNDLTDPTGPDLRKRENGDPTSWVSRVSQINPREADPTGDVQQPCAACGHLTSFRFEDLPLHPTCDPPLNGAAS